MRKEEGATVAATYLLSGETVRAGLVRAGQAAILHGDSTLWERSIKYHKCPTFDAKRKTQNTKRETQNTKHETPAIFSHLIDSPKQMKQTKQKMQLSLTERSDL